MWDLCKRSYLDAGVNEISAFVKNLTDATDFATDLYLRLALGNNGATGPNAGGDWFVSQDSILLEPDSGWTQVTFPIKESDMILVQPLQGDVDFNNFLSDVSTLRILSSEQLAANNGDSIAESGKDVLGIDKITASGADSNVIRYSLEGMFQPESSGGFPDSLDLENGTFKGTFSYDVEASDIGLPPPGKVYALEDYTVDFFKESGELVGTMTSEDGFLPGGLGGIVRIWAGGSPLPELGNSAYVWDIAGDTLQSTLLYNLL